MQMSQREYTNCVWNRRKTKQIKVLFLIIWTNYIDREMSKHIICYIIFNVLSMTVVIIYVFEGFSNNDTILIFFLLKDQ